jgi:hypothetical protein
LGASASAHQAVGAGVERRAHRSGNCVAERVMALPSAPSSAAAFSRSLYQ